MIKAGHAQVVEALSAECSRLGQQCREAESAVKKAMEAVDEAEAKAVRDCIARIFLAAPAQPDGEIRVADVVDAAVREVRVLPGRLGSVSFPLPLPRGFLR